MEKEMFELMSKMYGEMQEGFTKVNAEIKEIKTEIKEMKTEIKEVKNEVTKTNIVIENEIRPKIEALFDGYKQSTEAIRNLEDEIKELRISVNYLNVKTIKNENNIIAFSKKLKA